MTRILIRGLLGTTFVWMALSGAPLAGQVETQTPASPAAPQPGRGRMGMMAERTEEMAAADKRLDDLMRAMQTATGAAKVDSLAAVVVELVAQHKAMHGRMAQMGGATSPTPPASSADHAAAPGTEPHKH